MNLAIDEINIKYKTLNEISKDLGYSDNSYVSRKAKQLKLGKKVKSLVLLSPEEQEILKNSITRREKEKEEVNS